MTSVALYFKPNMFHNHKCDKTKKLKPKAWEKLYTVKKQKTNSDWFSLAWGMVLTFNTFLTV